MDVGALEPLIGTWRMRAAIPSLGAEPVCGLASFEYILDRTAVIQRAATDHPQAPDALAVIAPDGEAFLQHYFDARGSVRLYRMTFDGRCWELYRNAADFSALSFHQHFTAIVAGDRIAGRWERSDDGRRWQLDFELRYERA